MRWDRLFEDLEARLALEHTRELDGEVADRTRHERAQLDLTTRLLANIGNAGVGFRLPSGRLWGRLVDVGPDWALLERGERSTIVALSAVRGLTGLAPGARVPTLVARRFGLGVALRAVSRDRATVEVVDLDGSAHTGTIDIVGADHLELAEHPADATRRADQVLGRLVVPFSALGSVRRT